MFHHSLRLAALAACAASAAAASSWTATRERSPPALALPLRVALAPSPAGRAELEASFWAVSDPLGPRYGQHFTRAQAAALMQPPAGAAEAVSAFLAGVEGVSNLTLEAGAGGMHFITGSATVAALERIAGCAFERFEFARGAAAGAKPLTAHRCAEATTVPARESRAALPAEVARLVGFVHPSTFLARPTSLGVHAKRAARLGRSAAGTVTPAVIRQQYGIGSVESKTPSNKQVAGGFLGEFASTKDLAAFWAKDYPKATGRKLTIVGPNNEAKPGVEAMLDVEYITAIGGNVDTTFWYTDGCYDQCNNEPYTEARIPNTRAHTLAHTQAGSNRNSAPPCAI